MIRYWYEQPRQKPKLLNKMSPCMIGNIINKNCFCVIPLFTYYPGKFTYNKNQEVKLLMAVYIFNFYNITISTQKKTNYDSNRKVHIKNRVKKFSYFILGGGGFNLQVFFSLFLLQNLVNLISLYRITTYKYNYF